MNNQETKNENLPVVVVESSSLTVKQVCDQVQLIQQIMESVMKDNEHYGIIPGCGGKKTLLKPGAEKLAHTFRFAPKYEEIPGSKEEDNFIVYKIRCDLIHIPTGMFVGSGLGTCNSRERKYRSSHPWDIQNTLYKMACKRALVAAVLNATAASDIFTQDVEDMDLPKQPETFSDTPPPPSTKPSYPNDRCISEAQGKRLYAIYKKAGITDEQMKDHLSAGYGVTASKDIKISDYQAICDWAQSQGEPF